MQENKPSYYNELAIAAFTLSIISFLQLMGLEKSISAIVFGVLALKAVKQDPQQKGKQLAIIGIVLGIVYTILAFVMLPHVIEVAKKMSQAI